MYAKVLATNHVGSPAFSDIGNGAHLLTLPDAPTDLSNVESITNKDQIGMTWNEGAANGGRPVLDYQVSYDQAIDSWVVLETTISTTSFVAEGLQSGLTYKFKV